MTETKDLTRTCQASNGVLVIPWEVEVGLQSLAVNNPEEWQCLAEVTAIGQHEYRIDNLRFPKQENSPHLTDTDEEDYDNILIQMDDTKGFCWIHSHNTMEVFWSGTDYAQMDNQARASGLHTFSLVVNAAGDRKAALNMQKPIKGNFDLDVRVELPDTDLDDIYQAKLDEVQKIKTYTPAKLFTGAYSETVAEAKAKLHQCSLDDSWELYSDYCYMREGESMSDYYKRRDEELEEEEEDYIEGECPVWIVNPNDEILPTKDLIKNIIEFQIGQECQPLVLQDIYDEFKGVETLYQDLDWDISQALQTRGIK